MAEVFICVNRLGSLVPVDQHGRDAMAKVKIGSQVQVEVKRARNPKQHRLYWALINLIHGQQSRYTTHDQLSNALKCAVGWCDEIELKDGRIMAIPKSIAFANMKQAEFEQFFDAVIKLVITKILPGVKEADLRSELEEMTGVSR